MLKAFLALALVLLLSGCWDQPVDERLAFSFRNAAEVSVTGSLRLETDAGRVIYAWNGTLSPGEYVFPDVKPSQKVLHLWVFEEGEPCTGPNLTSPEDLDFGARRYWKLSFLGGGQCLVFKLTPS